MCKTTNTAQVIDRCHLDVLRISKCRWTGSNKLHFKQTNKILIYSGIVNDRPESRVAILMLKEAEQALAD